MVEFEPVWETLTKVSDPIFRLRFEAPDVKKASVVSPLKEIAPPLTDTVVSTLNEKSVPLNPKLL